MGDRLFRMIMALVVALLSTCRLVPLLLGTYSLVCSVMYTTDEGERKSIRKFFKFKVLKPVDIRPHCYTVKVSRLRA